MSQNKKQYNSGAVSSNSSSSTINNTLVLNANKASKTYRFEYQHLLDPTINEFRWHLNDEIFQLQQTKMKNKRVFSMYMEHIREGVRRKYTHCRLNRRKIVLNKKTTTTTKTLMEQKLKTKPASRMAPKFNETVKTEEDKSILNVDAKKFFQEFVQILQRLEGNFFNCKIFLS